MSKRNIPAITLTICDGCGKTCGKETGQVSHKRAGNLVVGCHALDYSGCAVGDGTRKYDLCDHCFGQIEDIIDKKLKEIKENNS